MNYVVIIHRLGDARATLSQKEYDAYLNVGDKFIWKVKEYKDKQQAEKDYPDKEIMTIPDYRIYHKAQKDAFEEELKSASEYLSSDNKENYLKKLWKRLKPHHDSTS